ncbi:methylated-DNA--[protein]-cysteine S-methyltransferase [Opitutus sp. ER46]|uniref:methylated-DNA--[protein]-cysteine S-methyltransferase n=1 Tax=Opitutus sp. ER46 TaxID=2161864 RepID=UPI000D31DBF7|nr:methylated-DNA--[protein]-cysteine S-methyltransferase [Opitutus sp. ER46]PTX94209.1 methylated-DNA--[protein]-cysteine S-methyltransferase [Opitutus sp. ER46]
MTVFHLTFATPVGDFSAAHDDSGRLVATAFGNAAALRRRLPAEVRDDAFVAAPHSATVAEVREQVQAYFAGKRRDFDLSLRPLGSLFQQQVWRELLRIPPGETRSYGGLARALGTSARAVGRANATNPLCLVIPCHRVVGADGSLTGFAFGEDIKRQLLALERAAPGRAGRQVHAA